MELLLNSTRFDTVCTEGVLSEPSGFQCFTLELPWLFGLGGSAISYGRFKIELLPSPKFELSTDPWVMQYAKAMPHLIGVPNRSCIMAHWGNNVDNTDGCILVGESQGVDFIGSSRAAFSELYDLLREPALNGDCFLTVRRNSVAQTGG